MEQLDRTYPGRRVSADVKQFDETNRQRASDILDHQQGRVRTGAFYETDGDLFDIGFCGKIALRPVALLAQSTYIRRQ